LIPSIVSAATKVLILHIGRRIQANQEDGIAEVDIKKPSHSWGFLFVGYLVYLRSEFYKIIF
jgi:hypothetical protein